MFLAGVVALASVGAGRADAPLRSLRPQMRGGGLRKRAVAGAEAIIEKARLSGTVAFSVADTGTGLILEGRKAPSGLPPASVAKAVTALYALDVLGPDHVFTTRLIATGPVQNGILAGDLILAGGGDPTLNTDALAEMAARLKTAGLREVRGRFLVWDGALPLVPQIDAGQADHLGYNPAISGLNLNYNRVHFEWKRASGSYIVTMDARSAKYRPDVRIARMQIANRKAPVYTYRDAASHDAWTVARAALGSGGARWLPVRKPALYAGEVFATFAGSHGIVLRAPERTRAAPAGPALVTHISAPLQTILQGMLKFSTNLTAEVVGMAATRARTGRVSDLRGSARAMNIWASQTLGMQSAALVDHSGLGDASRLSARDTAQALVAARRTSPLRDILKPITLRDSQNRPDKSHPVKVHAKTGTLNFVSALAGYIDAPDGTELAFAILTADLASRTRSKTEDGEVPTGARSWNRRAKRLQQALIERWGVLYGT